MRMSWNPKNIFSYFIKLKKKRSLKQILRFHMEAAIRAIESQIHEAVEDGDLDKTKQHLTDGIDPNSALEPRGVTPLHIAAGRCDPKIVEVLLENNAAVTLRDAFGDTPLHYAVRGTFLPYDEKDEWDERESAVVENMLAIVEMLASRGAKTNAINDAGQTPLDLARWGDGDKVGKVLRKHGNTKGVDWMKMPHIVKRIIWIVIICAAIGYLGNNYLQKRAKEKAQSEEAQRIDREIRSKVSQMVTTTNAVDDWVQKLSKGKRVRIRKILTIELEKLWMGERPILFTGSIEDISNFDEQNYNLRLERGLFSSFKTMFMTELALKLKCNKLIVDKFLQKHPDLLSNYGFNNGVVVIANIDKIVTEFIPGAEGERNVLKIGIGECIDIAYTGRVTF